MKKCKRLTLFALIVSVLMLFAVNTAYAGMNPPPAGGHWRGPAVLAEIMLTDDSTDEAQIIVNYNASCRGVEVSGQMSIPGTMDDITEEDDLLYFEVKNLPDLCEPPKDVWVDPMVSNVISFDDSLSTGGIQAKVLLLYNVGK